ncbi:MAG: hypothetical protein HY866_07285 [Chloroflexi bacterium]|nr:hypothetical protein [Chloroflexota bacterium]
MSQWDKLYCINHPERVALERCEVCGNPLCAYCLYYTNDGQRLCQKHAEQARLAGAQIEEPGAYAEQLIGAQVGADRKQKRGQFAGDEDLYKGNSHDVAAFMGMLVSLVSMGACCGLGYCFPVVGFFLSIVALINAGKAYDVGRTRRYALIGMLVSGIFVAILAGCIAIYGLSFSTLIRNANNPQIWFPTSQPVQPIPSDTPIPTWTPIPLPEISSTPTASPERPNIYLPPAEVPLGISLFSVKMPGR